MWRCHGVQRGHYVWPDARARCLDSGLGHPERDPGWLFSNRFRALWKVCLPHFEAQAEMDNPIRRNPTKWASAALRHSSRWCATPSELRGLVACCIHGGQWAAMLGEVVEYHAYIGHVDSGTSTTTVRLIF